MRAALVAAATVLPVPCLGQAVSVTAARGLTTEPVFDYRLTLGTRALGPVEFAPSGHLAFQGPRSDRAVLAGVGVEGRVALGTGSRHPYLVAGVSGGFVDLANRFGLGLWHAWSAGGGVTLGRLGPIGVAVEGRYQALSRASAGGVSLGLRLELPLGRRSPARSTSRLGDQADDPSPPEPRPRLATVGWTSRQAAVVDQAVLAMGAPYRWGGSDANGFDCSGLIHFAYRSIGVDLPRTSGGQAAFGSARGRDPADLAPGDILVFAARPGGPASHVGLYLGEGEFIHSASGGVQRSRLDPADPRGRWWHARWLGSRRILE